MESIDCKNVTLKPNSPGFSGSKSYKAVQQGPVVRGWTDACGVLAGDRIGDGNGDAEMCFNANLVETYEWRMWHLIE